MTRADLARIKGKPHGPDVAALIQEVERCWDQLGTLLELPATIERELRWLKRL